MQQYHILLVSNRKRKTKTDIFKTAPVKQNENRYETFLVYSGGVCECTAYSTCIGSHRMELVVGLMRFRWNVYKIVFFFLVLWNHLNVPISCTMLNSRNFDSVNILIFSSISVSAFGEYYNLVWMWLWSVKCFQ